MLRIELRTWCLNFTMIQRWMNPKSSFFWDRFGGLQEKKRALGGEERKTKMRGRRGIVGLKTDLTYRYLHIEYSQLIVYSIHLFLLFYKKEYYFISYQMNKSIYIYIYIYIQSIIFLLLFFSIYLIIKTSLFSKTLFIIYLY